MNRNNTVSPYPIKTVRGPVTYRGVELSVLIDHDKRRIVVSSLVPLEDRPEYIAEAIRYAVRDQDRKGQFSWIKGPAGEHAPDHFVVELPPARKRHRPLVRSGCQRLFNAYACPSAGVTVTAWPDRPLSAARALCRRAYRDPSCLDVMRGLGLPGVTIDAPRRRRRVA